MIGLWAFPCAASRKRNEGRLRSLGLGLAAALIAILAIPVDPLRAAAATDPRTDAIRLGFSPSVFGDVNETDAQAAIKIWARTIVSERGINIDPQLNFFGSSAEIEAAMRNGKVDGVQMNTVEFWSLRSKVLVGPTILESVRNGKPTEEYILLVRRDDPATRLADLRGRSLAIVGSSATSLAAIWLESLLLEQQLGVLDSFWGRTTHTVKASRVVLPVFFRQLDACVITAAAFRILSELNPQVGQQLRIIAQSPALLSNVFCFRRDLDPHLSKIVLDSFDDVTTTKAGRQTLALFQTERIVSGPLSDLDPTLALLDHYHQLREAADRAATKLTATAAEPENRGDRR